MSNIEFKETCQEIIKNQLTSDPFEPTIDFYHRLLEIGVNNDRAIDVLAYYIGVFIKAHKIEGFKNFTNEAFRDFLNAQTPINHSGEYYYDRLDEQRNLKTIKKRYGNFDINSEQFDDELNWLGANIAISKEIFELTDLEIIKILNIVIDRLLNLETQTTSDYNDYASEEMLFIADNIEKYCNPFINQEIKEDLSKIIDVDDPDNYDKIFKNILLMLSSVKKAIETWHKNYGEGSYYRVLADELDLDIAANEGPYIILTRNMIEK